MTSRKPTAAFWIAVAAVLLPMVYVASFGPACWWFHTSESDGEVVNLAPQMYWPIGWLAWHGPEPLSVAINWYATLGVEWIHVPSNLSGDHWTALMRQAG